MANRSLLSFRQAEMFDTRKFFRNVWKHETKLKSLVCQNISKCLKLNRPRLRTLSFVLRTWFPTAWSTEFCIYSYHVISVFLTEIEKLLGIFYTKEDCYCAVGDSEECAIPKIKMLHNFSCLVIDDLLHSSLDLAFRRRKLHNIFIFGMAYRLNEVKFCTLCDTWKGLFLLRSSS